MFPHRFERFFLPPVDHLPSEKFILLDFSSSMVVAVSVPFPEVLIRKGTEIGLHFPEFLCISLHFSEISLHFSSVLYISLHFFTFLRISLYFLHFSEFLYISQHFSEFLCISLHFSAFLYISVHFSTFQNKMVSVQVPTPTQANLLDYSETIIAVVEMIYFGGQH